MDHLPDVVRWHKRSLSLLDQTRLPHEVVHEAMSTVEAVWDAILQLKVRGAPAIGVAAAYGLCVAMDGEQALGRKAFLAKAAEQAAYLKSARPTAVNLAWAVERLLAHITTLAEKDLAANGEALFNALCQEAEAIHAEDIALCAAIGEAGKGLIEPGMGVLTHCNAGALATAGMGTATASMYCAHAEGVPFTVYADETRPLLQGARLTAWELQGAGIDVRLITDNMAAHMMATGKVNLVMVGADRVAANGDAANKIGTSGVAIAAKYFNIPFYVAVPYSTIDMHCPSGADIPIEERGADEVRGFYGHQVAPEDVAVRNPAFDVTPADLIAGIITERGIIRPPFTPAIAELMAG